MKCTLVHWHIKTSHAAVSLKISIIVKNSVYWHRKNAFICFALDYANLDKYLNTQIQCFTSYEDGGGGEPCGT
jgi:hypothetical protein